MRRRLEGLPTAAALALLAALLVLPGGAAAHDGWLQVYAPVVRVGQVAHVDLMLGNHANEHRSYRIAGKLDPDEVDVTVVGPGGDVRSLDDALFDAGEADATPPPGPKGYLSTAFVPRAEGIYVVAARGDAVLQHGDAPPFRSLRLAKTLVAAARVPLAERAREFTGYDRAVGDDRLEIIPKTNLTGVWAGEEIVLELRLKGRPLAGQTVAVIRRSTAETRELVTDQAGMVRFPAGEPDYYLVRVEADQDDEAVPGEYAKTTYEATLTYVVQARPESPAGSPTPERWPWLGAGVVLGALGSWLVTRRRRVDA